MTQERQDKDYRPCVGMMILNQHNQVFMARRADVPFDQPFAWQMPQGGVDAGEAPQQAAIRELVEEIGTDKVSLLKEAPDWVYYDFPLELVGNRLAGKYKGQKQKWFLFRYTGTERDINLSTDHPEFSEWKWCNPAEISEMVIPFKKGVYQKILEEFSSFLKVDSVAKN